MDSDNSFITGIVTESYLEPLALVLNPIQTASFASQSAGIVLSEIRGWKKESDAMMNMELIKKDSLLWDIHLIY